ncbi:PD40 domain-containing protein [bacterium]|nr:PD40 domain-containing protein [bacterium]
MTFKRILPDNTLEDIAPETFEIYYEDEKGRQAARIAKWSFDHGYILSPADAEYSSFLLLPSPDKSRYIVQDSPDIGLWLIVKGKTDAVKISKDNFNGKIRHELRDELFKQTGHTSLFWNPDPVFSPDSSKIVFTTNRDCTDIKGNSIWLQDLSTGKEGALIKAGIDGHYSVKGWIDNEHIIYTQGEPVSYYLLDITGNAKPLKFPEGNPAILAFGPEGTTVWEQNRIIIYVAKVAVNTGDVINLYENRIDGTLRDPYNFSPDSSKFAYLFVPNDDDAGQSLTVLDLKTGKDRVIKPTSVTKPASIGEVVRISLHSFSWLDNKRLLIHIRYIITNGFIITSWIYNLEGGGRMYDAIKEAINIVIGVNNPL